MNLLQQYNQKNIESLIEGKTFPEFGPGDTVKVHNKIIDGATERIQIFEGVCIARKTRGIASSFKVLKQSSGTTTEKHFSLYSPKITKIEVVRRGRVKRAKIYYLRSLKGKAARIKERMRG